MRAHSTDCLERNTSMTTKVLILGANGFIGNALVRRLLTRGGYEVMGVDLTSDKLHGCLDHASFRFLECDITVDRERIDAAVAESDVVLPLVAIATPALYVQKPLEVFEVDFEENLRVVRSCVEYEKRIIFPSTSEVYGMCQDHEFDEDTSTLVMGPIHKQRWIYGCLKQLLDRVIWAYGLNEGLRFTIFRPFNWIGPKLDAVDDARIGSSRAVTQLIGALMRKEPIKLVDGGLQQRCFTYISDGIDALEAMIVNRDGCCDQQIFNVGNPNNECSIKELARRVHRIWRDMGEDVLPDDKAFVIEKGEQFYGKGYQDLIHRRPNMRKAFERFGWTPQVDLDDAVRRTVSHFFQEWKQAPAAGSLRSARC